MGITADGLLQRPRFNGIEFGKMKIQDDPLSAQKEDALFCLESDGIVGRGEG